MGGWFEIPDGPLLTAAERLLKVLRESQADGMMKSSYRVGDQRRAAYGKREIEIIFEDASEREPVMARYHLEI